MIVPVYVYHKIENSSIRNKQSSVARIARLECKDCRDVLYIWAIIIRVQTAVTRLARDRYHVRKSYTDRSLSKNSIFDGFTYMYLLFNVNFTKLSLRIFISSTSRSWIHSDEAEVDCRNRSISIRFYRYPCFTWLVSGCLYY